MSSPNAPVVRSSESGGDSAEAAPAVLASAPEQMRVRIAQLRDAACERARPLVKAGAAPIRVMAKMVADLEATCREQGIPREIMRREIVNRTIGDIDVRGISARDDGPEYATLADDMGIALPGEQLDGYTATGERYRWIRACMEDCERELLARHMDMRMYELSGAGNLPARERIAEYARSRWDWPLPASQTYLSLGSLDGLGKFFQGFAARHRQQTDEPVGIIFPAPGFNVPEWQATTLGMRLHRIVTRPEDAFKVTPAMLRAALDEAPDIRAIYLTVSSNPTAFAYTAEELRALFAVLHGTDVLIVADLAYIGTGDPEADRARMRAFYEPETLVRSVLCCSFSKSHTLTGDRFGYVGFGSPELATQMGPGWTNSTASLPAEWQFRYMAVVRLFAEHPELEDRIRALYRHRRQRLVQQLRALDKRYGLFAQINLDDGGTVYNWSQLRPGEDVFTLFSKTGIAGVPGSAFGYSDDFIRLSVGCIPVPAGDAGA